MRNPHAKIGDRERTELIHLLELAGREPGMLKKVFADILTPAEINEIVARWQIIKRLAKGESHRSIATTLHVSVATVYRGAWALEKNGEGFHWMLRR
ncbi:MAG: Trp family transcriptional regulator [bacterium]|nr:Trp family transcriptional regulator [bacterium]